MSKERATNGTYSIGWTETIYSYPKDSMGKEITELGDEA